MPSLLKSISLALVAGYLVSPIGWQTVAHAQGIKASTAKNYPSTGNSQNVPRSTAGAPRTATKGVPRVSTAPNRGQTQLDNRPELPAAQPARVPRISPELEAILAEWETKSAKIKRLEGTFTLVTYDSVFGSESHADGKYCFEYPDKGSFQFIGRPPKKGAVSPRGFTLKEGKNERWLCDGERVWKIDDKVKQYEKVEIPAEDRGQNIRNSPLPFVFGMKADEAKQRYRFELNAAKTNEDQIILRVFPLEQRDLANYQKADVQLNRETCIPMAVKLYDTTGDKEQLYLFSQKTVSINTRTWAQWAGGDPLKPALGGYHEMVQPSGEAKTAPGTQLAPRPTDRRSAQAPGSSKVNNTRQQPQRTAQLPDEDEVPTRSTKGTARP